MKIVKLLTLEIGLLLATVSNAQTDYYADKTTVQGGDKYYLVETTYYHPKGVKTLFYYNIENLANARKGQQMAHLDGSYMHTEEDLE